MSAALLPMLAAARLAPPDARVKASAVHWTVGPGQELHGFMAVPESARGRQPAVLLIGDRDIPGEIVRALVIATAQAGFVCCSPNLGGDDQMMLPALRGTVRWLAENRYGTGKVAAIGVGGGASLAAGLARDNGVAAIVLLGEAEGAGGAPLLQLPSPPPGGWQGDAWNTAWAQVTAFLRQHLT